jgi:choline dehydrogenase
MGQPCDYLIVGGGTAGCVVARVLAERGYRVTIVEAGLVQTPPLRLPAGYLRSFGTEDDWAFTTVPQPRLAERRIRQPRGRGPGGSTRINAMIWYPPRPTDLRMLAEAGGLDWAPERLAASLDAVTAWVRPEPPRWLSTASRRFLELTHPAIHAPHAFARMTDPSGRKTAADLLADSRSILWVDGLTERLLFAEEAPRRDFLAHREPLRVIGAEIRPPDAGPAQRLFAERGVILCGGTIGSPTLLLRSGIGSADVLNPCGIVPRVVSEEVGRHLVDHLIMPVIFGLPTRERFPTRFSVGDLARWQVAATGPASSNLAEAGAIYALPAVQDDRQDHSQSPAGDETGHAPEQFQVHLTPTHYLLHPADHTPSAMTLGVNLCRPRSRGSLTIRSADPRVPPDIDPRYLADETDGARLIAAVGIARELARAEPFAGWVGEELLPGIKRESSEATLQAIRRFSQTLYHPVGTCRMTKDGTGVVDTRCRVRGTVGLHVIDASVLPDIPSINPNATVMALAHLAATRIAAAPD